MPEPPALPIGTTEPLGLPRAAATTPEFPAHLVRKVLLVTACALLLYSCVLAFADYRAVGASLRQLPLSTIVLTLTLATSSFLLRFARWHRYLRVLGIDVSLFESAVIFTCGLGMGITPGKAGELLKPVMLHQVAATPIATSVPILLAERITDALAIFLLVSLGFLPSPVGIMVVALVIVGCGFLGVMLGSRAIGRWFIAQLSRLVWLSKHRARLESAHEALLALCAPARLLEGLVISLLAWGVHGLCLLSVARVYEGVSLSVTQAFLVDGATALAGALAMLPGGIGLTEASMTGALVAFGHGHVTPAVAAAITLAVRVMTLWWAVALGMLSLGLWQMRYRRSTRG